MTMLSLKCSKQCLDSVSIRCCPHHCRIFVFITVLYCLSLCVINKANWIWCGTKSVTQVDQDECQLDIMYSRVGVSARGRAERLQQWSIVCYLMMPDTWNWQIKLMYGFVCLLNALINEKVKSQVKQTVLPGHG